MRVAFPVSTLMDNKENGQGAEVQGAQKRNMEVTRTLQAGMGADVSLGQDESLRLQWTQKKERRPWKM